MIDALKKGDEKAYRVLYDEYYDMLCTLAYHYVKDAFLAESLVGDVIYNLWKNRDTLQIHTSLKAYMVKSVQNKCVNFLEHQKVVQQSEKKLIQQHADRQQNYFSDMDYPLTPLIVSELEEQLARSLDTLQPECRKVFQMSRTEELTYAEIAEKLNISIDTVKYHMKNALVQLREQLKNYLPVLTICFLM
jgi:RNA polymerase sigma-70 factor (ECF subfamily)